MELPEGFVLATVLEREDPRDALVSNRFTSVADLPWGALVGTSSLRRVVQLMSLRPDLRIEPLRGNLDTRLRKLDEGGFDAIVLAAAGLKRLGLAARIRTTFDEQQMIPAAKPMAIEPIGLTNPQAGVIATRPATAPEAAPKVVA